MSPQDFKLTKEEVAVSYLGSPRAVLEVPIYPKLLLPDLRLDREIPKRAFEKAVQDFYDDLSALAESGDYPEEDVEHWRGAFLAKRPEAVYENGELKMAFGMFGRWDSYHDLSENGFMWALSISRDMGGSLHFRKEDRHCHAVFDPKKIGRGLIRITNEEKALAYSSRPDGGRDLSGGIPVYVYATHNVDKIPGALMLRNWAMHYQNDALDSIAH